MCLLLYLHSSYRLWWSCNCITFIWLSSSVSFIYLFSIFFSSGSFKWTCPFCTHTLKACEILQSSHLHLSPGYVSITCQLSSSLIIRLLLALYLSSQHVLYMLLALLWWPVLSTWNQLKNSLLDFILISLLFLSPHNCYPRPISWLSFLFPFSVWERWSDNMFGCVTGRVLPRICGMYL